MRILGIETSCDDTSVAIYDEQRGLVFHSTLHQNHVHAKFKGIVPELAARSHLNQLLFLIKKIFLKYPLKQNTNVNNNGFHAIAYTIGPGLASSLLVGATIAGSISLALNIPCIFINHLEGHLLSVMLSSLEDPFPCLVLLVSGANTQLICAQSLGQYIILGNTRDDSAGNVFDYTAKLLDLGFPGGKKLSDLAQNGQSRKYIFPRPMTKYASLNFSFSGLKTHVRKIILNSSKSLQEKSNIARSLEEAIVETLIVKCELAIQKTNLKNFLVCGGVSANHLLRKRIKNLIQSYGGKCFFPKKKFCTDNAAMIAYTGFLKYKSGVFCRHPTIVVNPNLLINETII
ncbi:tRNA (adenosine(37)-N6)-threonylcarbamoyltransferase complex transferase subunit TsaD [Buchnera aphidicola]|uniref:tRNA (adenosine(37)-N6)-threonylcarbamoyltransferase complex transferase subunit TsaD n=1 Tax=Buchnera aphidicola TaxID=9 RepID=UPI00094C5B2E|nr:tRNA (adenosine(37)-N6)-threonylcarbamoyltransferase complex transferase subunit TsaD [Buchnera aphidicola]